MIWLANARSGRMAQVPRERAMDRLCDQVGEYARAADQQAKDQWKAAIWRTLETAAPCDSTAQGLLYLEAIAKCSPPAEIRRELARFLSRKMDEKAAKAPTGMVPAPAPAAPLRFTVPTGAAAIPTAAVPAAPPRAAVMVPGSLPYAPPAPVTSVPMPAPSALGPMRIPAPIGPMPLVETMPGARVTPTAVRPKFRVPIGPIPGGTGGIAVPMLGQAVPQRLDVPGIVAQLCAIAGDYAESRRRGKDTAAENWRGVFNMTVESRLPAAERSSVLAALLAEGACKIDAERLAELAGLAAGPGRVAVPAETVSALIGVLEGRASSVGSVAPGAGVGEAAVGFVLRLCAAAKGYTAALKDGDVSAQAQWDAEWRDAAAAAGPRAQAAIAAAAALCPDSKRPTMASEAPSPGVVEISTRALGWLALAASAARHRRPAGSWP